MPLPRQGLRILTLVAIAALVVLPRHGVAPRDDQVHALSGPVVRATSQSPTQMASLGTDGDWVFRTGPLMTPVQAEADHAKLSREIADLKEQLRAMENAAPAASAARADPAIARVLAQAPIQAWMRAVERETTHTVVASTRPGGENRECTDVSLHDRYARTVRTHGVWRVCGEDVIPLLPE